MLKMIKVLGTSNKKARECYETGAVIQRPWARYSGDWTWTVIHAGPPAMKAKGFTLVELVVACTLLIMLSMIATTSTFNFVQATANLKAQYNNIQNIMALHSALVQAKMNYATDLAFEIAQGTTVTNNQLTLTPQAQEAQHAVQQWNISANQNDGSTLINRLINPDPNLPAIPLAPLNPGSRSYLPTSRNGVQIADITSLLKAYQLTDDGTPTGNPVATIAVGAMLDVWSGAYTRPTLPIIDWRSGTAQEIQF